MAEKTHSSIQNPLDWFLDWMDDENESRLAFLARQVAAEPFNADSFRDDLTTKLKRLRYPQPDPEQEIVTKTFHALLEHAGVLPLILSEDTLRELWKCRLLKDIFQRDIELQKNELSVQGRPLSEHKQRVAKIRKDLRTLEKIAREYGLEADVAQAYEKIAGECIKALRPIATSRYSGSKAEVILSRPSNGLASTIRSEQTAIQAIIYRRLKQNLQTKSTEGMGISGIFLCQLSELIWADPNVQVLGDGETIWRAEKRLPK
jgi:hypothetical protein